VRGLIVVVGRLPEAGGVGCPTEALMIMPSFGFASGWV